MTNQAIEKLRFRAFATCVFFCFFWGGGGGEVEIHPIPL